MLTTYISSDSFITERTKNADYSVCVWQVVATCVTGRNSPKILRSTYQSTRYEKD
jgi:hypothetical protein